MGAQLGLIYGGRIIPPQGNRIAAMNCTSAAIPFIVKTAGYDELDTMAAPLADAKFYTRCVFACYVMTESSTPQLTLSPELFHRFSFCITGKISVG